MAKEEREMVEVASRKIQQAWENIQKNYGCLMESIRLLENAIQERDSEGVLRRIDLMGHILATMTMEACAITRINKDIIEGA